MPDEEVDTKLYDSEGNVAGDVKAFRSEDGEVVKRQQVLDSDGKVIAAQFVKVEAEQPAAPSRPLTEAEIRALARNRIITVVLVVAMVIGLAAWGNYMLAQDKPLQAELQKAEQQKAANAKIEARVAESQALIAKLGEPTYRSGDWDSVKADAVATQRTVPAAKEITTKTWVGMLAGDAIQKAGAGILGTTMKVSLKLSKTNMVASWSLVDPNTKKSRLDGRILALWMNPDAVTVDAAAFD